MIRRLGAIVLAAVLQPAGAVAQAGLPAITLRPGLVITRSARVVPGTYRLPAPASLDSAAVVVRGDGITLDLSGATLLGAPPGSDPDRGAGVAIRIESGRGVTLRGGRIRGYRIGVMARGTRQLTLRDMDASHNWKPRLYSQVEKESLADWLSFHQNEKGEWLRFGAGFYLDGVSGGELRGNRVVQGMNGLLVVRGDHLRIVDNEFAFNSGLGIGLYRSSDNSILHNRLDYNVRGYSHGFYRRGQDSAALLLYEQSSRNVVAYNSATHSGDGLFLWAGQSTMDAGEGGSNDNLFFQNDFSFAPTNAMEATFSRNAFVGNLAEGSDYGLWGGYSFESKVVGNCFIRNRIGVAIEHGQDNVILDNRFLGDSLAIRLWANAIEPSDWGYPKHRDTRSRDYRIEGNRFLGNKLTIQAANTGGMHAERNDSLGVAPAACAFPLLPAEYSALAPAPDGSRRRGVPARTAVTARPRNAIVVDEWGPYDWRSPRLWPVDSTRAVPLRLAVLGPAGRFRVVSRKGIQALSAVSGQVGDTLVVTPAPASTGDWELWLETRGRVPVRFGFARFEPAMLWSARFFKWTDSTALSADAGAFAAMAERAPILTRQFSRLDIQWYRPQMPELPLERWGLEAGTTVDLPPGSYRLRTISDDGIRVWVDGALAIERWSIHESAVDEVPISGGRHDLRVQYFQSDGWTELRVEVLRQR